MPTQEEKANKALYPSSSVSDSARRINADEDLFRILVAMYKSERPGKHPGLVENHLGGATAKRQAKLRAKLSSDKKMRRKFAVEARKFLSERKAGDAVEAKRLKSGKGRTSSVLAASRNAQTKTTALGRAELSSSVSRVKSLLDDSQRLGQAGALG